MYFDSTFISCKGCFFIIIIIIIIIPPISGFITSCMLLLCFSYLISFVSDLFSSKNGLYFFFCLCLSFEVLALFCFFFHCLNFSKACLVFSCCGRTRLQKRIC
ncbi:hypothetical protein V8G54_033166 [Vigna mungo]|uniref:Uncharacterized protein n=1 Tax=Vigna mungo TaxID=3915 RepID=A0AAQ3RIN5_VIGMU